VGWEKGVGDQLCGTDGEEGGEEMRRVVPLDELLE